MGSYHGVGLSYDLKRYRQESGAQEAPGAEHKFTRAGHKHWTALLMLERFSM